jgi:phenylalanyl-tRNA synthetase beta chain
MADRLKANMKLSANWVRDFVDLKVDDRQLAEDLTSVGIGVEGISGDGESTVFEAEITTNRPDEMNHYGIAREAAAIYDVPLRPITPKLTKPTGGPNFPIEIQDTEGCARFTARIVRGIKIGPSPAQIVRRLALLDQRPINLAVDATNYALWEMGKPTHAFDLDLLEGGKIVVRRAAPGETLKTLDGVERTLSGEDLVVADSRKPVALAGVMGGYDTMITDKTRNVLIESAWWDPITIRKTSKRHGLHTDASHRFERGADFESTILSCDRVAELILQAGGGQVAGDIIDHVARRIDQAPVALHMSEVHRILGCRVTADDVVGVLKRLGFDITPERMDASEFTVQIPSWRLDVEREIDLIEEVARLYGYDKFPNTLPTYSGAVIELPDARKDGKLRSSLLGLGYNEAVSLTFIAHEDARRFSSATTIEVANPLSEEASVMRTSMLPGMLNMLAYNLNRGIANVRLFEAGKVYQYVGVSPLETKQISMGATGSAVVPSVNQPARPYSFFDLKGDIETLLRSFEHESLNFDAQTARYYHPGRSARAVMDGVTVAQFGQIHPYVAAERKLRQDVFVGELYLDRLYNHELGEAKYEAPPRYPAVERDFSFVFADAVVFENIQVATAALNIQELRSFVPVEIFRGGAIPAGRYSVLLRAIFQSGERTLREDEVARWSSQIIQALESRGGTLRA